MIQTFSMAMVFVLAMGIGPALGVGYMLYAICKVKIKKLLTG